jgi:hypothetical protein
MIQNGLSYKDLQLGNQINEVLNEYNSLVQKIKESKQDLMFNSSLFNNKYSPSYQYDKSKLKNMSYISKKEEPNFYPYSMLKNYNDNALSQRKNETIYNRDDLIEEFKKTLGESQIIKNELLNSYRNNSGKRKHKSATYNNEDLTPYFYKRNQIKPINTMMINKRINKHKVKKNLNKSLNNNNNDINDSYSNGRVLISKRYNLNGGSLFNANNNFENAKLNKINNNNDFYENEFLEYDANEEMELKVNRDNIIKAYQKIKRDNRILEVEINNYKKLANQYLNFNDIYNMKYNRNYPQKTIDNYKQSLQNNIQNNCRIIDLISNIQKKNDSLDNKIKILKQKNKIFSQKIEQKNRKDAEIQILNEENEQKLNNLEEEKNALTILSL